ncbi:helix-turn-helix transcriptional regulator [Flavivirga aquimarina]|uniref:Helix-turn-helix transcriptional regulator n=2 Tax=Flavivirga aquimarina TaxID=2027862 RepID=A0ABT8WFR4_9FLAO|nr:helix-turn-helix transcriptional regulator [Flavivirga aquimarina]MDO5972004.1 helix-turn-helix transcriptional regulator [Flavivirga aquimarina]
MDRGLTQHKVAKMIGVNRNFVYEMELNHHTNTIYALHKVFTFFGYTPKTLNINESTLQGQFFSHRIKYGFTYNVMAQKIGVDKSTIARFERGGNIKKETEIKINNYVASIEK